MFWFPKPDIVGKDVIDFLEMEKEYLSSEWGLTKIFLSLLIPLSFIALGTAFWKRNLCLGGSVLIIMAVAKMLWAVALGGAAGKSAIAPAVIGLVICISVISLGFRKLGRD